MYNLLIVDDEPLITDSLYDLFTGNGVREYNVLKAYSGREALGWMEKTRIDILLTDISMPDVSGLDVHRHVSALWPECAVIYLTSFDEFDYVQQAIRNNGQDYILKTEGDGAVATAVEKAATRLDADHRDRLLLEQARNSLSLALPLLQGKFLSDLADAADVPDDLERQLANLRLPLRADYPVLLLLGQADGWPEGTATERMKQVYSARGVMESYFTGYAAEACAVHDRTRFIMLLQPILPPGEQPDQEQYAAMAKSLALRVSGSLDSLQSLCQESCGLMLSFAASGALAAWKEIGAACDALRRKLHDGAGGDGRGLLYFDHGGEGGAQGFTPSAYLEMRQQASRLGQMKACLENGDRVGFLALFDTVMAAGGAGAPGYDARAELYYRMAAMLIEYVNKWDSKSSDGRRPDIGRLVNLEGHASWDNAVEYFRELSESLFRRQVSQSQKQENKIFTFIRDYTEKNLGGDLTLTRFAMLLNFHPFYLSRLFKQIAGMSLSDYVSGVKLEKAKEMLSGGTAKVSDISTALGFMTSSYFTSFFRKHTGMSPVEYRNKPSSPSPIPSGIEGGGEN